MNKKESYNFLLKKYYLTSTNVVTTVHSFSIINEYIQNVRTPVTLCNRGPDSCFKIVS